MLSTLCQECNVDNMMLTPSGYDHEGFDGFLWECVCDYYLAQ